MLRERTSYKSQKWPLSEIINAFTCCVSPFPHLTFFLNQILLHELHLNNTQIFSLKYSEKQELNSFLTFQNSAPVASGVAYECHYITEVDMCFFALSRAWFLCKCGQWALPQMQGSDGWFPWRRLWKNKAE